MPGSITSLKVQGSADSNPTDTQNATLHYNENIPGWTVKAIADYDASTMLLAAGDPPPPVPDPIQIPIPVPANRVEFKITRKPDGMGTLADDMTIIKSAPGANGTVEARFDVRAGFYRITATYKAANGTLLDTKSIDFEHVKNP